MGFFHALSLPSNSTNLYALRQVLVVCVFRDRSEPPETSVKSAKNMPADLKGLGTDA